MDTNDQTEAIHPLGEGEFAFPTPGGRVRLSVTNDSLTPFGGLVPWAAYTKHIGIIDRLAADCPTKAAIKLHTLLDLRDSIPAFVALTEAIQAAEEQWLAFTARWRLRHGNQALTPVRGQTGETP